MAKNLQPTKAELDIVIRRAAEEVAKWPHWLRSPDVLAELSRLKGEKGGG